MSDQQSERELGFESRMSDAEALMWNLEKDPWLNPNGGMVTLLDRPIDAEQFRRRLRFAVAKIPRLRERVVPGLGRLSPPVWVPDAEFDFDYHLRHISLPPPGSIRQLYDLVTRYYEDPFDRTRSLWQFVIIDGADSIGASWRDRWDSLVLFTPRRYDSLPGLELLGDESYSRDGDEAAETEAGQVSSPLNGELRPWHVHV